MAIDNRLQIYDEQGNLVDYDIMATDVKFSDGKDLPTKLAEAGGGYEPPVGGIPKEDLAPGVQTSLGLADTAYQKPDTGIPATDIAPDAIPDVINLATKTELANKVDKVSGKGLSTNDYTDAEKTKLAALPTNPVTSISVNGGTAQTPNNGNVNLVVEAGGLTENDIDVSTQEDGVVVMTFGNESYSVNLNHSHSQYLQAQVLSQAEYDALTTKDSKTLYIIQASA